MPRPARTLASDPGEFDRAAVSIQQTAALRVFEQINSIVIFGKGT
jgi:hypothetical protein